MKNFPLVLLCLLAGCTSQPTDPLLQLIHNDLLEKFTPIYQDADADTYVRHTGEEPFTGDCDDYYAAARSQLIKHGFTPVAFTGYFRSEINVQASAQFHVMACAQQGSKLLCLDPERSRVTPGPVAHRMYEQVKLIRY